MDARRQRSRPPQPANPQTDLGPRRQGSLRTGHRILDADLAELYGVEVKRLNQQVKRNAERFPGDFVYRVKAGDLRLQIATSKTRGREERKVGTEGRGGRRYQPYAFTEYGAIMAATVLNSKRAVEMSIFVVRAFVRMREARHKPEDCREA